MPAAEQGESNTQKPVAEVAGEPSGLPRFDLRAAFIARQQQLLADLAGVARLA